MFDQKKDKTLKEKVFDADRDDKDGQQLEVKLVSYNEGPERIQISRFDVSDGERKFLKLGRLSVSEAAGVRDAITELIEGA